MGDYRELKVWQRAHDASLDIYRITRDFPNDEKFGIVSQIRRAAISIPTNIAEGSGRLHLKDYINFLGIARGSAMEVEYLLLVSKDLGFIDEKKYEVLINEYKGIVYMLNGLINSLRKKLK